jgi:hypothetical protein
MNDLRKQLREAQKQLKSQPDEAEMEANIRSKLERENAIESELVGFGHPKGIGSLIADRLGEADVTREAVAEALTGIGYEVDATDTAGGQGSSKDSSQPDLANVADLSSRVQSAGGSGAPASDLAKVESAQTREELRAIAAEGGWLDQGS